MKYGVVHNLLAPSAEREHNVGGRPLLILSARDLHCLSWLSMSSLMI